MKKRHRAWPAVLIILLLCAAVLYFTRPVILISTDSMWRHTTVDPQLMRMRLLAIKDGYRVSVTENRDVSSMRHDILIQSPHYSLERENRDEMLDLVLRYADGRSLCIIYTDSTQYDVDYLASKMDGIYVINQDEMKNVMEMNDRLESYDADVVFISSVNSYELMDIDADIITYSSYMDLFDGTYVMDDLYPGHGAMLTD